MPRKNTARRKSVRNRIKALNKCKAIKNALFGSDRVDVDKIEAQRESEMSTEINRTVVEKSLQSQNNDMETCLAENTTTLCRSASEQQLESEISGEFNDLQMLCSPVNNTSCRNTSPVFGESELSGRRIVNFASIFHQIIHFPHLEVLSCRNDCLHIIKEHRIGLQSSFKIECDMCRNIVTVKTDPTDESLLDINTCAVVGTTATGCGYSQLRELLSTCNIPCRGPIFIPTLNRL